MSKLLALLRPALVSLLAVLVGFGVLPQELADAVSENLEVIVGGLLGLVAIVDAVRRWRGAAAQPE